MSPRDRNTVRISGGNVNGIWGGSERDGQSFSLPQLSLCSPLSLLSMRPGSVPGRLPFMVEAAP